MYRIFVAHRIYGRSSWQSKRAMDLP